MLSILIPQDFLVALNISAMSNTKVGGDNRGVQFREDIKS